MTIGNRLKIVRGDMNQYEFAEALSVHPNTVARYERGERLPDAEYLERVYKRFSVSPQWLLTGKGLMRKARRETFNIPFLAVIIEALEEYEMDEGKKLTPEGRADFISTAYDMCIDDEAVLDHTKDKILKSMRAVYDLLTSLDLMIKTKKGRERARKLLTKKFKIILSKDETEWEVGEFIDSRTLKTHSEEGTLKFPVKDKDGTIRLIDDKDLNKES